MHETSGQGVEPACHCSRDGAKTRFQYSLDKSTCIGCPMSISLCISEGSTNVPMLPGYPTSYKLSRRPPNPSPTHILYQSQIHLVCPSYAYRLLRDHSLSETVRGLRQTSLHLRTSRPRLNTFASIKQQIQTWIDIPLSPFRGS